MKSGSTFLSPTPTPLLLKQIELFYDCYSSDVDHLMHALTSDSDDVVLSGDSPNQLYISDAAGVCQCVGVCGRSSNTQTYTLWQHCISTSMKV